MARLAIAFCLITTAVWAETPDPVRQLDLLSQPGRGRLVISPAAQAEWAAVGRVVKQTPEAGRGCTGVLIAPDLVLTAAHCIWITEDPAERPAALANRLFVAGWNRGALAALSGTAEAWKHPQSGRADRMTRFGHDFAFLRLAEPPDGIAPLPFGPPPAPGETLAFIGYSNDHSHAPVLHAPCPVLGLFGDLTEVACRPSGGHSGSPLLRATPDGWEVAGLMVARSGRGGLAAIPDPWVLGQVFRAPHPLDLLPYRGPSIPSP